MEPMCDCGLYNWQTCSRQPCMRYYKTVPSTPPAMKPVYTPPTAGNIPWPYYTSENTWPSYMPITVPVGCICPPGANKECENPTCPRKPKPAPSSTI